MTKIFNNLFKDGRDCKILNTFIDNNDYCKLLLCKSTSEVYLYNQTKNTLVKYKKVGDSI